jgi:hypothetical protein
MDVLAGLLQPLFGFFDVELSSPLPELSSGFGVRLRRPMSVDERGD